MPPWVNKAQAMRAMQRGYQHVPIELGGAFECQLLLLFATVALHASDLRKRP